MPVKLSRPVLALIVLSLLALVSLLCFMTLGAKGSWSFVLPFRGRKLLALVLVAYAVAVSTVLFQTVTNNRILTPSIMGFDALYILLQTAIVFFLGAGALTTLNDQAQFGVEIVVMVVFSGLLFRWLFLGEERSLHLLVLVGIVFGILFRSLSQFMQRLLDPNAFNVLQDSFFASFATVDTTLLTTSTIIVIAVSLVAFRLGHTFDVLALGRSQAINLGVPYKRTVVTILMLVSVLVAVSTALVGPITFFGLLVASLAHGLVGTSRHKFVLPAAVLLSIIFLVGGQTVLERVFAFDTALSIIIEFLGGIVFIFLVLRRAAR
ncbi:iron chelate uptake ABC transporter family permease subunit [Devosia sp. J2-20]|jgi:iron complex transport system permease protein|uniref:Iron chelate uptake ABC transporter family permease subunit n=1 Tax=Devosia litorisediminis TaxID=2829817 RepID=A0A942EH73_9HYPH|nr:MULTISPECIES: iron chelate uptake ABC transporter family permease subunit [Devosia]MBS3849901.1 iron chelate uptake ABC transporter family permease subunit [Devosia litorisediminis]MCZ4346900.1 iron chelate uptake ABC transporter family permease subunit [Devosia neptuniae]WDR00624.1 iron chelate uptake ABC transporter family permease subunit [Devosia sp. J2-20]|tara:strand:+ start:3878 stop:4840 length:963 start_codon:yes stop_codon:yes gene_type:complete